MTIRRNRKPIVEQVPTVTAADRFKARLGWRPSLLPFHTSANRECGGCHVVKRGAEFDVPITPGRPDLNTCRECGEA
jgi:hypothetical protein